LARRRFFVEQVQGERAELRGDEARRLARVLRAEPGQRYEISDNRSSWLGEIVEARPDRVVFRLLEPLESVPLPVHVDLCAALVKFDRFEWMIEKATELGVDRVLPLETTRTEKGLLEASRKRSERWVRVAREASQQSRRVQAPQILPAARFSGRECEDATCRLFLEEAGAPPLLRVLPRERSAADRVALAIGPEGGWTDEERRIAAAAGWLPVSLSPLVLRAETAAAAALAIVTAAWME
jgi:16S rRNA (uracil1498-N3)-methyltransferase